MSVQARIFLLILIMSVVAAGIGITAVWLLYDAGFEEERQRLTEIAKSQARLIEAIARFDKSYRHDYPNGPTKAALSQIKDAHGVYEGFGRTGEFTLARREADYIEFILSFRDEQSDAPYRIPIHSRLAEPMRRALAGLSGTLVGLDYRGVRVLAAHEPVGILDLGIVAKIDLAEIREPFLRAAIIVGSTGLLLILGGILVFFRVAKPIIQSIADSEKRFRDISHSMADWVWEIDRAGRYTMAAGTVEQILGYKAEELLGKTPFDLMPPEEVERISKIFNRIAEQRLPIVDLENLNLTKNGKRVLLLTNGVPILDEVGQLIGYRGIDKDITERRRAEEKLRSSEEQLRLILASTGEGIFGLDMDGRCTFANRACLDLLGYGDIYDLLGKRMHELIHHTHHDGSNYPVEECPTQRSCTQRQVTFADDEPLWRADGSCFHAEYQSFPMVRGDEVLGAVVSFSDITERKSAEEAVKRERDFAESLIETAPVIVLVLDPEGKIVRFNSFMEQLSGYSLLEVKGKNWFDTFPVERGACQIADVLDRIEDGGAARGNLHAIATRDGEERLIAWHNTALRDSDDEVTAVLAIGHDVTEQKAKDTQLIQAQKMEMVGQLTGGIAHDFNNLLTVILGNLELLNKSMGQDLCSDKAELLQDSLSAAKDGAELTQRLLSFSRKRPLRQQRIDLPAFLSHSQRFLRRTLGADIVVELDVDSNLDALTCDPHQLESALLNLALNARDAMPDGGRLGLAAKAAHLDPTLDPAEYIEIAVTDTGVGMTSEQLTRAVEPFYTTKGTKQGSGLGLSMVFNYCEQAGGRFRLASEPGVGTRASIILPLRDDYEQEASAQPPESQAQELARKLTALVVEDDERVRKLAGRYLRDLGYNVLTAENGDMAIEILESESAIDLVFSDLVMPGKVHGEELYRWIKEQRPDLKVLLTTGLRSAEIEERSQDGKSAVPIALLKPYTKAQLADAISDVLAI